MTVIEHLARQRLQHHGGFHVHVLFVLGVVGVSAEILEMQGHQGFLAIETDMAVHVAHAGDHQPQHGNEQQGFCVALGHLSFATTA